MAHYGIYGAWLQDGRLVTVRKSRGPYFGLLDLPGGTPEGSESAEETLRRELNEECGVIDVEALSWHPFDFFVEKTSAGEPLNSHHTGSIALVRVLSQVQMIHDVEDVASVELIDPTSHPELDLTPPLHYAVSLILQRELRNSALG